MIAPQTRPSRETLIKSTKFLVKPSRKPLINFGKPSRCLIIQNYLDEKELKVLNNIVSGYFDFAEIQAMRHNPMYMSDYVEHLDNILKATGEKLLEGAGSVSHAKAMEKANEEYQKYQIQNLSPVEEAYLLSIKDIEKQAKKHQ